MPYGTPKTEAEREREHKARYGTSELPPRGTGLKNNPGTGNPKPILPSEEEMKLIALLANKQTIRINKIHQWEETKFMDAVNTTTDTLDIDIPAKDDRVYIITHLAAVNNTKNITTIRLFNVKAGQKHILNQDAPSAAAVSIPWDGELITGPGQKLRAEFWGNTANDDLYFTASGYWIEA